MIDLHCHMLPYCDDGAKTLAMALDMARLAVEDGITITACTPHIAPGIYDNRPDILLRGIDLLQQALDQEGIELRLVAGCDAHVRPDFLSALRQNQLLTLNASRYVLFEPTHSVLPPRMDELLFNVMTGGYVPVLTHPERLTWIEQHYDLIRQLARSGVLMQVTAGSLTGRFGPRPRYWAERMVDEGLVFILASDGHNLTSRRPILSEGVAAVASRLGEDEAWHMVLTRPRGLLADMPVCDLPPLPDTGYSAPDRPAASGSWGWLNRLGVSAGRRRH